MRTSLTEGEIKHRFAKQKRARDQIREKKRVEHYSAESKIKRIESTDAYQRILDAKKSKRDTVHNPYLFYCQNCDASLPKACPVTPRVVKAYFPERMEEEKIVPCPSCGKDPRIDTRSGDTIQIAPDWDGVFCPEFPVDDPNYVPGRGVPMDRARAREYAKRYGMEAV